MPGRLRQSAGQRMASAQEDGSYNIPGLDFHQSLTWRAGKAIPVADLLSRLQKLGSELRGLDQGQVSAKEFKQLAQDLAHSNLLGHKDKGIRAWTLCSIVDILNICAPDAPFNPGQLRDIFKVVNNLLQNLDDPTNAYNAQHVYILNSLTDTKSIVLITDLERSEELITPLFRICFDIVSGASQNVSGQELAKSVEFQLRSMLVTIIDEANLPHEAIDVILSQFLRVDPRTQQDPNPKSKKQDVKDKKQDTLRLKDYPAAYNMAKSICTTCPDKMTVYVTQYVGTIIMNSSAALKDEIPAKSHARKPSEVEDSDEEEGSLTDLRKVHRLVRELWRACPDVLINVIPQVEVELFADSASLRQLATETLGDMIAGMGISGPPPNTSLDPNVYPLPSIDHPEPGPLSINPLLIPASPKPFASVYSPAFQAFLGRRVDKSPLVRNAWAISVGRILLTDAGGIGLSSEDRQTLLAGYAGMLKDTDDRVRHTAIQSMNEFDYHSLISVLTSDGALSTSGTVLSTLAERVTDRKHNVREDAMSLLGQIWGTASRDIENNVEKVISSLGEIPSRICNAMYVNDLHIHTQLDKTLYESLLPLSFPPVKTSSKNEIQKRGKSNTQDTSSVDPDQIRVRRILTLVHNLDAKAKQVFFGIQKRQVEMSKVMKVFLKACEDYNGGVVDNDSEEQQLKDQLTKLIQAIAKQFPDSSKATADLWKFVKMHDRRNYQLIRFATGPEHDYRTMSKAIKELAKRISEGSPSTQSIMETLQPLLYRSALIVYNRSHVPAIMEISRTDDAVLAETAHEVLKEISTRNPEVLKTHIQALCKDLVEDAPSSSKPEMASAADTLKACAGFARKYPAEVPKDRKFLAALTNFARFSHSPRAAKHAVTIILTVTDKKELHAKELISQAVKNCKPESPNYLAKLATISQICLLSPVAASAEEDAILEIAVTDCLKSNRSPETTVDPNAWEATPGEEAIAKELALKVMVNRCRSGDDKVNKAAFDLLASNVLAMLMQFIEKDGEFTSTDDTPSVQRNRLRLTAAHYILKLCSHKRRCEELVTPKMFTAIALIVINPPNAVRSAFVERLQKYLGRGTLHARWHTILMLFAFEPDTELKSKVVAWLKSRNSFYSRQQKQPKTTPVDKSVAQQTVMENIFTRLLSLLAHHPDYPDADSPDFEPELLDFARYIVFYLQCVATDDNISLIFHIAQRVKQTRDAVTGTDESSERLYVLSDLAQAVIKNYADLMPAHAKGVNLLQTWPGQVALPTSLFAALPSHSRAQEIAAKNYLPEDVAVGLEKLVRMMVRGGKSKDKSKAAGAVEKKRKSDSVDLDDSDVEKRVKKVKKSSTLPIRRTPKSAKRKNRDEEKDGVASVEQPSRKSARTSTVKNYTEDTDEEDGDMYEAAASSPIKVTRKTTLGKKGTAMDREMSDDERIASGVEEEENVVQDEDVQMEEHTNGDNVTKEVEGDEASNSGSELISGDVAEDEDQADIDEQEEEPVIDIEADAENEDGKEDSGGNEDEDEDLQGTPSPKPKVTRATRNGKAASTRTNGTPKSTSKTRSKPTLRGKDKVAKPSAVADTTENAGGNTAIAVSQLNAIASAGKGKGKGKKSAPESPKSKSERTDATAVTSTRRSTRNKS